MAKPGGPGPETDETTKAARLAERMGRIRNKIFVLSGKGGVGKSTVAVNLAVALALAGKEVGLLDVDFHGPSIPKLLKMEDRRAEVAGGTILPVPFDDRLKVISIGFMLTGRDDAVIWRGPMKMQVIRQFLEDVAWGTLDYLVIDSPPGTGDEPLSVAQLIPDVTGAIVVTTPQELSLADVRRCIGFCRRLNLPVLGVIENMSGFVCPNCGERVDIFKTGGGEAMARSAGVPFLGRIPLDARVVATSDAGRPLVISEPHGETTKAFLRIARPIIERDTPHEEPVSLRKESGGMRIALPMANGRLAMHFGHCQEFVFVDVDPQTKGITGKSSEAAPGHQPGLLPRWLAEHGASVIIAGGMGSRAQSLFAQQNIQVVVGAPSLDAESLVQQYVDGVLQPGDNICDH
ncbi:MAG: chromosome partitioning protein ParA [Planctomycetes bacterium DG_58]|nr:MAG: chromosome partitioning protein ParA [Planctomycetes bacterium DG_58]